MWQSLFLRAAMVLLVFLLLGQSVLAAPALTDIESHWARPQIQQLLDFGIVGGYPDGTFRPEDSLSRAAFVKMLVTAKGLTPVPGGEAGFDDLAGHWTSSQGYIAAAVNAGIVMPDEYPDGKFEPDRPITRQEIAVMVVRALGMQSAAAKGGAVLSFRDADRIPSQAKVFIAVASGQGIIGGFPDGTFGPDKPATRAQAAVMVMRMLNVSGPPKEATRYVRVVRAIDGDTLEVQGGEHVRLIGVNTPEIHHPTKGVEPYGAEAAEFTRKFVEGKYVRLEKDVEERDRYGRLLAYVYLVDGTFVNAELVEQGYAQVMTVPPNVRYQDLFLQLQREAREAGRGLWGLESQPSGGQSDSGYSVVISGVDLAGEVVTIENRGSVDVDLSGWRLVSEVGNQTFTLPPGTVIKPGGTMRVVSGPRAQSGPDTLVWTKSYIWNNDGDPAVLYDGHGKLVFQHN